VPFRAGDTEMPAGAVPAQTVEHAAALAAGPSVLLADISEFQPEVTDGMYLLWSKAIIIRAAYGTAHEDRSWFGGARRDALHAGGARFVGIYQYVVAGQDPAAQARVLVAMVKAMRPGEKIIGDFEEGAGNQAARRNAWAAVIRSGLGDEPWTYSGLSFADVHGLAPVEWVAAYGQPEPSVRHRLWQFTDNFQVPGVGRADASIFHGTIDQLAALAWPARTATWTETLMQNLPTLGQGDADHPGQVQYVRRIQALVKVIGDLNKLPAASAVKASGKFDQTTAAGVKAVQKFFGLAQDAVVGQKTWGALVAGEHG
jgi:hypothetical protein